LKCVEHSVGAAQVAGAAKADCDFGHRMLLYVKIFTFVFYLLFYSM